ncbi:isochorismate-pyruvate lyase [Roseivivax jejudonensis]|uniref:chorismate mutase n=1 Tax=Roseivivax jejudonensis TaxID=1529041 RepID=A0A1X6ZTN3_9RHOB|nr:chorismate mutase [Roseivivax jejudonensis]SLN61328.1 isochorismate-pyruvate lyase [Roseivivax jejudonensis]
MRDPETLSDMAALRSEIDATDRELVDMLAHRSRLIDRAAVLKPAENLPARIDARVEEVVGNIRRRAVAHGLDPDLAEALWRHLIDWSIRREEATLGP